MLSGTTTCLAIQDVTFNPFVSRREPCHYKHRLEILKEYVPFTTGLSGTQVGANLPPPPHPRAPSNYLRKPAVPRSFWKNNSGGNS